VRLAAALVALAAPQDDFWSVQAGLLGADHHDARDLSLSSVRLGLGRFIEGDLAVLGEVAGTLVDGDPSGGPDAECFGTPSAASGVEVVRAW
jgi:hypothetical protein